MVADTGLFTQDRDFHGAGVADAPTTTFTLHADGHDVTISVYALGMGSQMSSDEAGAQQRLASLEQRLTTLDSVLTKSSWTDAGWHAFQPTALRLFVRNADADPPDPSGIGNQLMPWPASEAPNPAAGPVNRGGQCVVVTDADAAAWLQALGQANQLTRFVAGTHHYAVQVRPLLPDEPRQCPPARM
jgi:hypothetical protein